MPLSIGARALRALTALPFIYLAVWAFRTMDLETLDIYQQSFAASGVIEWDGDGGKHHQVAILDHFHGVEFLDQLWRGGMGTFSTSTFGYDSVSAWQVFSFLIDLGPVYAIWILESGRPANAWTPAYLPTIFTVVAQLLGIGPVAPAFYFLCIVFGPTASDLVRHRRSPHQSQQTAWHGNSTPLLPIVFLLHTTEVLTMFLATDYATRHYWTWAWQLSPLWIGLGNAVARRILPSARRLPGASSPKPLLAVLGLVSAGVWVYTLARCPHPLATVFLPDTTTSPPGGFLPHVRRLFQADAVGVFAGSFLWLAYSFFDLYAAGLAGAGESLFYAASLPFLSLLIGPGAAFLVGWCLRERILAASFVKA